jgi:hypothetical protein
MVPVVRLICVIALSLVLATLTLLVITVDLLRLLLGLVALICLSTTHWLTFRKRNHGDQ